MMWRTSTVGQVFNLKYGKALPERNRVAAGTTPVYGSNGIVGRHDKAITAGPTIIIGRKGSAGRVAYSAMPCWPIDTTYFIDDFGGNHDPRFWTYQFEWLQLDELEKSSAIPGLSRDDAYTRECVFPDLEEQRCIAAKLDHITTRLDDTRARLDTIPGILKRFRAAVLAAAVSGKLTEDLRDAGCVGPETRTRQSTSDIDLPDLPPSWRYERLGTLIKGQKYGTSKRCGYDPTGKPVLRIPNIGNDGQINGDDLKYGELSKAEHDQLALQADDVLVIRSNGSVSLVGKAALVSPKFGGFAYAGYLIRLRVEPGKVMPAYLNKALASPPLRLQIEIPARSTSGVHNINSEEIGKLLVPLPPINEQSEIVRRVEKMFREAAAIQARYRKARSFTDKLMPSVLARAFRGELA